MPWCEKNATDSFDVTIGSFDGAESCELVGLFLLFQLKDLNINVGLYRDDGLAASCLTNRQNEQLKKQICQIFKNNGLNLSIECNKKVVIFLDVTLDLSFDIYRPYTKPNEKIQYVNVNSDHPPHVLKNIPSGVNTRLSLLSSNEEIFNQAVPKYQEALNKSGYKYILKYSSLNLQDASPLDNKRRRNIIWYNSPRSRIVKTNIGKEFF